MSCTDKCDTAEKTVFCDRVKRKFFNTFPFNHRKNECFKEWLFSKFPALFEKKTGCQEWKQRKSVRDAYEKNYDTGLIVPKNLPLTSIIIPAYNNIELTRRCLDSVYAIESISPFEVIVVDDGSSENYGNLKWEYPNLRVIRNNENSGFLRSANRGAAEAGGEYILFLNNDTEVLKWYLDELTTALYTHPDAGMIGSHLIHLNSARLQESGQLICKNGTTLPLGGGGYPDDPQFSYFREVDFCSAASIIMRKKVFEEMGGFDEIYIPAYYEDIDLALRLKKAGYKNYVAPHSRVIHMHFASYGGTPAVYNERNRKIFMERWQNYLQANALYDSVEDTCNFKGEKERVLYIDAELPMADRGSGGMDAIFFMEYMIKRGYHVTFYGEYTPGYHPKYTGILLRMGVQCIYDPFLKIWDYIAHNGHTFSYLFISRIYEARCFDWILKPYCANAGYIFNTVDVHFVREFLEADLRVDDIGRQRAKYTKQCELAVAAAADATIVISSEEKKMLENEYNLSRIYHVPQARKLFGLAKDTKRRGTVFIGSAHPPNMDGLKYFHDEVLPLLPEDFELTIIGEALQKSIETMEQYQYLTACKQFHFAGFVQELATKLDYAKITIAPLRYGAGTKGKVASSMAHGVPCVSSSFGTEGTGMVHGENIMIADTPQEFAAHIIELMNNQELWQRISDGGIKFIQDNYSYEAVEKMMDDLFADVKKRRLEKTSNWASTPTIS
ncbi:MAG: glycosyltransferase [Lentisphaeria bacterium]|nr:glycosyltransferase [Lentisphaeria bacterium]